MPDCPPVPLTEFHAPAPALAGCVRAFYVRDLRVCQPGPSGLQCLTVVPPGPYQAVVWRLAGTQTLLECAGRATQSALPAVYLTGAHRHRYGALALSPTCVFGLVFQPGALGLLSGLDMAVLRDRVVDASVTLPLDWQDWLHSVAQASGHAHRQALCEAFLAPRWADVARREPAWVGLIGAGWREATRVAQSGLMRGADRWMQRQVRRLTGLRPGEVQRLLRLERALTSLRDGQAASAECALQEGFADQAHFNRAARQVLGQSPVRWAQQLDHAEAESHWLLRL